MENDNICVFCGQKLGVFRNTTISCAGTWQPACKACEKELKELDELELCHRALLRGMAVDPDRLRKRVELITNAEDHRPKCLGCGAGLHFMKVQQLDNSPIRDSIFHEPFSVRPAYCESCGRFEFYHPQVVRINKYLAYLIEQDTQD